MTTFALLITLLAGTNNAYSTQPYGEAYQTFQETGRPLVILVGADWCPGCRTMKMSSLPAAGNRGIFKDVSVTIVDVDQSRELSRKLMRGNSIPQLIMYYKTDSGTKRVQLTGAQSQDAIEQFVGRAFAEGNSSVAGQSEPSRGETDGSRDVVAR